MAKAIKRTLLVLLVLVLSNNQRSQSMYINEIYTNSNYNQEPANQDSEVLFPSFIDGLDSFIDEINSNVDETNGFVDEFDNLYKIAIHNLDDAEEMLTPLNQQVLEYIENSNDYISQIENQITKIDEKIKNLNVLRQTSFDDLEGLNMINLTKQKLEERKNNLKDIESEIGNQLNSLSNFLKVTSNKGEQKIEEIKIESEEEFNGFLSLTNTEIELFKIFSKSIRKDLEDIVIGKINDKLNYYQDVLSTLSNVEENDETTQMINTVSKYIKKLNSKLDEIKNIDEHPFPFLYSPKHGGNYGKLIKTLMHLVEQLNNFDSLSDKEKNNLIATCKTYPDMLKLFIPKDSQINQLRETHIEAYQSLSNENLTEGEQNALKELVSDLEDFEEKLVSLKTWIPKFLNAFEEISSGIETAIQNPEDLDSQLSEINSKVISELLGIDLNNITIDEFLEKLGVENLEEFNNFLKMIDDELDVLKFVPLNMKDPLSIQGNLGFYIRENQIGSKLTKYKHILEQIGNMAGIDPLIDKIIGIIKTRKEILIEKYTKVIEIGSPSDFSEQDLLFETYLEKIVNKKATWDNLIEITFGENKAYLQDVYKRLKEICESSDFSKSISRLDINIDMLNELKSALNRALSHLNPDKVKKLLNTCSYLRKNSIFIKAFSYLEDLYQTMQEGQDKLNTLISGINKIIDLIPFLQEVQNQAIEIRQQIEDVNQQIDEAESLQHDLPPEDAEENQAYLEQLRQQRDQLAEELNQLLASAEEAINAQPTSSDPSTPDPIDVGSNPTSEPPNPPDSSESGSGADSNSNPNSGSDSTPAPNPNNNSQDLTNNNTETQPAQPQNETGDPLAINNTSSPQQTTPNEETQVNTPFLASQSIQDSQTLGIEKGLNVNEQIDNSSKIPHQFSSLENGGNILEQRPNSNGKIEGNEFSQNYYQSQNTITKDVNNTDYRIANSNIKNNALDGNKKEEDNKDYKKIETTLDSSNSMETDKGKSTALGSDDEKKQDSSSNPEDKEEDIGIIKEKSNSFTIENSDKINAFNSKEAEGKENMAFLLIKLQKFNKNKQRAVSKQLLDKIQKTASKSNLKIDMENAQVIDLTLSRNKKIADSAEKFFLPSIRGYLKKQFGELTNIKALAMIHTKDGKVFIYLKITTKDGKEKFLIVKSDTIVYIDSNDPRIIIKEIIKRVLFGKKSIPLGMTNKINFIIIMFFLFSVSIGVIFALGYAQWEGRKYFSSILKEKLKGREKIGSFLFKLNERTD
jgi:DNA repair exonuclease SbcCD ATPase subunit